MVPEKVVIHSSTLQTCRIYARIGIFRRLWFLFLIPQFSQWARSGFLHWVFVYNHGLPCISSISQKLYITKTKFCISSLRKLCNLRLMIYALGDDIHTKVWWYTIAFAMDKKISFRRTRIFWSWKRDSNTRPAHYEWAALPTELFQQNMFKYE